MKIWLRVLLAAVGVAVLALVSSPGGDTESTDAGGVALSKRVVDCEDASAGQGSPEWRESSIPADVVGIGRRPLSRMTKESRSTFTAKMPVLVEGHHKAAISVVPSQVGRVELVYGADAGALAGGRGFDKVQFRPCEDRYRTVWPGGIRVTGRRAVRLRIHVENEDPFTISLGRPTTFKDPPNAKS